MHELCFITTQNRKDIILRKQNFLSKWKLIVSFVGLIPFFTFGQLLDNSEGQVFTDEPFFNTDFIKEQGIETVSGRFLYYQLGKKMEESDYFQEFTFNKEGQLIKKEVCNERTERRGSNYTIYTYDDRGNVASKVTQDFYDASGYFYKYDSQNRISKQEFRQNLTRRKDSSRLDLGVDYRVTAHRSSYRIFDNQLHQTVYNQYNRPYTDIIIYFDSTDRKVMKEERLRMTKARKLTTYSYKENELLDTVKVFFTDQDIPAEMTVFEYNEKDYVTKRMEYRDGELSKVIEVIYKENTPLVNDVLIKDVKRSFITVVELRSYTYFDGRELKGRL